MYVLLKLLGRMVIGNQVINHLEKQNAGKKKDGEWFK